MRTRGQKLKEKQQGLPSSPPLQLSTPPRRPRLLKKGLSPVQKSHKQSLDSSSEIIFHFNHPLLSPKTPRQPIALGGSSGKDSEVLRNGFRDMPKVLDKSSTATDAATDAAKDSMTDAAIDAVKDAVKDAVNHAVIDATASDLPRLGAPVTVPAAPHTILHLWLDATQEDLASARPGSDPSIAMALPSSLIPDLLRYIARPASSTSANTLTLNASSIGISPRLPASNKRKLGDDAEISRAAQRVRVEISQPPKRQRKRGVFSRMPLQDLDSSHPTLTALAVTPPDPHGPATTFTRGSLYSKDGSLQLGLVATSQVISPPKNEMNRTETTEGEAETRDRGDRDEQIQPAEEVSTIAQIPTGHQPVVETPRSGRWGFGDLLKSARSVSKYLPGFPRALSVSTPVIVETSATDPTPSSAGRPTTNTEASSQSSAAQALYLESSRPIEPQGKPETKNPGEGITNQQNKSSKTGIQTIQKKGERDRNLGASSSKARQSFADGKKDSTPGTKRKRLPSPEIIPNPGGSSYGMDLDYFVFSSSEEENELITPTKARPSKHRRIRGPNREKTMAQINKGKAQPYRGGFFSSETLNYEGGNIFNEVSQFERSKLQAKKSISEKPGIRTQQPVSPMTPITNLTGSFRVPSPSDSDSDPENSPARSPPQPTSTELAKKDQQLLSSTSATPKKPSSRVDETSSQTGSFTSKEKTSHIQSPPSKAVPSPPHPAPTTWTQPPPPRPNPPHAALPSPSSVDSEALARARKKALHYQPHKPSGLRASSRISSPRILEDTNLAVSEGNATSMSPISTSGDTNTALATRSENTVASKLGQSDTSTITESVEKVFEKEVPDIATKENATSLTPVESAPLNYVRDPRVEACLDAFWKDENTKQASNMFEVLYAAFVAKQ